MDPKIEWWGYRHTSGTLHLKRYFGPLDISEANESPFVQEVVGPFAANTHEEATLKLKELLL